jgi:SAM-dependent methyltransferase
VLELGTGWTHFFGLFLRLLFPAKIVMFDVQDCRQLDALRMRFARLADAVDRLPEEYRDRRDQVRDTALEIAASTSFSQLYDRLGCEYVVEESGSLARFDDADFSMVFSVDVFEHVARDSVPDTIQGVARVLAPGGISAHTISVADHLAGFAPGMPPKSYAGFSDKMWRRLFENRVQYVNRMQACEFADQFASAGLALQDAKYFRNPHALDAIRPAGRFLAFDAEELEIVRAELVHTKPRA